MEKAINSVGEKKFFDYSGLGIGNEPPNNCQYWCKYVLEACKAWTSTVSKFTMQNIEELAKEIPELTKHIMNKVTDLGQLANKWLGKGLHKLKIHKSMGLEEAHKHAQKLFKTRKNLKHKVKGEFYEFKYSPKTHFKNTKTHKLNEYVSIMIGEVKPEHKHKKVHIKGAGILQSINKWLGSILFNKIVKPASKGAWETAKHQVNEQHQEDRNHRRKNQRGY